VANQILGNIMSFLVGDKPIQWKHYFARVDFIYNNPRNTLTRNLLFIIIYSRNPREVVYLINFLQYMNRRDDVEAFVE